MPNLVVGSILEADADAIVNPANSFLRHGGGLARLIADAAAPKVNPFGKCDAIGKAWWDEQFRHPSVPTGGACVTSAGHLPFKGIIHAVGPIWKDGTLYERELLEECIWSIGETAEVNRWSRIAVPAISCGLFRFPVEEAAAILWATAEKAEELSTLEFTFYVMPEHVEAFEEARIHESQR